MCMEKQNNTNIQRDYSKPIILNLRGKKVCGLMLKLRLHRGFGIMQNWRLNGLPEILGGRVWVYE